MPLCNQKKRWPFSFPGLPSTLTTISDELHLVSSASLSCVVLAALDFQRKIWAQDILEAVLTLDGPSWEARMRLLAYGLVHSPIPLCVES